jgi:hypothetical protein
MMPKKAPASVEATNSEQSARVEIATTVSEAMACDRHVVVPEQYNIDDLRYALKSRDYSIINALRRALLIASVMKSRTPL